MNVIVIGNDADKVALDIWKNNTNYVVLNKCPSIFNKALIDYIADKQVILSVEATQFEKINPNKFVDFMIKYNFVPIFIRDIKTKKDDLINLIYHAVDELLPDAILYTKNPEKKDYDEFIKLTKKYVLTKGNNNEKNNIVRTPRKRKTSTSKK